MKLWFDTETSELVTEQDLRNEYQDWLIERTREVDAEYMLEHHDEYTFESWVDNCTTRWNGTLYPVTNADKFKEVKLNA